MSISEVQQRIAQIERQLATQIGSRAAAAGSSFASALRTAQAGSAGTAAGGTGGSAAANAVIDSAKRFLGVPYRWGGTDPSGFDCSGLLQYVYKQHGVSLPRVAADQARAGRAVTAAEAQPGDLVAFGSPVDHIGMYIGDGKMIVAPHTGASVRIEPARLDQATAIRRVLPDSAPRSAGMDAAWTSRLPAAARAYTGDLAGAAAQTGVDPKLIAAVAWTESGFNAAARSSAGAVGLMQIMPQTARGLGVDPADPRQALLGVARYLASQLGAFDGRVDLALAAYNAGPSAVRKHGGVPPYAETQSYVTRVLDRYRMLGGQT